MKNGRKIFKFLKFVGEFKKFIKVSKSGKPLSLKATLLLCVVCRFFYYVLDNILWAISIGNLSEVFSHDLSKKVKSLKDSFLLIKAFLKISEASYAFLFKLKKRLFFVSYMNWVTQKLSRMILKQNEYVLRFYELRISVDRN